MRSRRSKVQLYGEILRQVRQGSNKTCIGYQAKIPWLRLNKHLNKLTALGLIKQQSSVFTLTDRGVLFLKHYRVIDLLLCEPIVKEAQS